MKMRHRLCVAIALLFTVTGHAQGESFSPTLTALKSETLAIQRDLALLESALQPHDASMQLYMSVDIDTRFTLQDATLVVNGRTLAQKHYGPTEQAALSKGGAYPLLRTELPAGTHNIELRISGKDQSQRPFTQNTTFTITKVPQRTKVVAVHLADDLAEQRYRFGIQQWNQ